MCAGRYRLIRLLGKGKFARVWLARDTTHNRYVVIKMLKAQDPEGYMREMKLWNILKDPRLSEHPGRAHLPTLLDFFKHGGAAGQPSHGCFVFEPLGRTMDTVESHFQFEEKGSRPHAFFRLASKQLLLALDCLHSAGIMHRDINQGNILLALGYDIDSYSELEVEQKTNEGNELNEKSDAFPLHDNIKLPPNETPEVRIILTDLGAACKFEDANDFGEGYGLVYRAPESVLRATLSPASDIWNLGCIIYHMITSFQPFPSEDFCGWTNGSSASGDGRVRMNQFIEVLGPMPKVVRALSDLADDYVNAEGNSLDPFPEDERELPLAKGIEENRPVGMGDEELELFKDFMASIFKWDPAERPSTKVLLEHPWIKDIRDERDDEQVVARAKYLPTKKLS